MIGRLLDKLTFYYTGESKGFGVTASFSPKAWRVLFDIEVDLGGFLTVSFRLGLGPLLVGVYYDNY